MFYHLDIEEQLNRIMNRISFCSVSQIKVTDSNELRDICDGVRRGSSKSVETRFELRI
jgi:hypothetical protein